MLGGRWFVKKTRTKIFLYCPLNIFFSMKCNWISILNKCTFWVNTAYTKLKNETFEKKTSGILLLDITNWYWDRTLFCHLIFYWWVEENGIPGRCSQQIDIEILSNTILPLNFLLVGWGESNPPGQVQPGEPAQPRREHAHRQHPLSQLQVKTKPR